jgi:hypothetical protein
MSQPIIEFIYRNYKGRTSLRRVRVDSIEWISHPGFDYQPGWFLSGIDLEKDARRSFALSSITLTAAGSRGVYKLLELN